MSTNPRWLAMRQLLREGGAALDALEHDERAALNGALAALTEGQRLAHKLAHAAAHDGRASSKGARGGGVDRFRRAARETQEAADNARF